MTTVNMNSPTPFAKYTSRNGTEYDADANGNIAAVALGDVVDLLNAGCTIVQGNALFRYQSTTGSGNTADTNEDTLESFSLPAGFLDAMGINSGLLIECWGKFAANGDSKTVKLYFGSSLADSAQATAAAGSNVGWYAAMQVRRIAAGSQIGQLQVSWGTAVGKIGIPQAGVEDTTKAVTIKCTATASVANANDIVLQSMVVTPLS